MKAPGVAVSLPTAIANPRILVIDDDPNQARLVGWRMAGVPGKPYTVEGVDSFEAGLEAIKAGLHDAYLIDQRLGRFLGTDLITMAREAGSNAPLIVMTAHRDAKADADALRAGADDFLLKGETDATSLDRTLRYAMRIAADRQALEAARRQVWTLEQIGIQLTDGGATPEALAATLDLIAESFGFGYLSIYLIHADRIGLAAQRGYRRANRELEPTGLLVQTLRSGRPRLIPSVTVDPDSRSPDVPMTELCVPLVNEGRPLGALLAGSAAEQPIGQIAHAVLVSIGQRIGLAVAFDTERRELRARNLQFRKLVSFARVAADQLAGSSAGSALLEALLEVIPARGAAVLVPAQRGEPVVLAASGEDPRRQPSLERLVLQASREQATASAEADGLVLYAAPVVYARRVLAVVVMARDEPLAALERDALPLLLDQMALALAVRRRPADARIAARREAALLGDLRSRQAAGISLGVLVIEPTHVAGAAESAGAAGAELAGMIGRGARAFVLDAGQIGLVLAATDADDLREAASILVRDGVRAIGGAALSVGADPAGALDAARGTLELARRAGGGPVIA